MNQITIAGHLGADPEIRFTSSGKKVTTLRVAAKARRSSAKEKDETIWWRVTIWGEQFDAMMSYFKKGSPIIVFGELSRPEIFTDREGRPQVSMNITASNIMFSPFGRPDSGAAHHASEGTHEMAGAAAKEYGHAKEPESFSDEEIPF